MIYRAKSSRKRHVAGSRMSRHPKRSDAVTLTPKRPPGRTSRKARAFAADIGRLRTAGYTCEAIREALADAGVQVSKSTVQREVARHRMGSAITDATSPPSPFTPADRGLLASQAPVAVGAPHSSGADPLAHGLPASEGRSGKDIAQAFVRNRITNPLMRTRSRDEDSRH